MECVTKNNTTYVQMQLVTLPLNLFEIKNLNEISVSVLFSILTQLCYIEIINEISQNFEIISISYLINIYSFQEYAGTCLRIVKHLRRRTFLLQKVIIFAGIILLCRVFWRMHSFIRQFRYKLVAEILAFNFEENGGLRNYQRILVVSLTNLPNRSKFLPTRISFLKVVVALS